MMVGASSRHRGCLRVDASRGFEFRDGICEQRSTARHIAPKGEHVSKHRLRFGKAPMSFRQRVLA